MVQQSQGTEKDPPPKKDTSNLPPKPPSKADSPKTPTLTRRRGIADRYEGAKEGEHQNLFIAEQQKKANLVKVCRKHKPSVISSAKVLQAMLEFKAARLELKYRLNDEVDMLDLGIRQEKFEVKLNKLEKNVRGVNEKLDKILNILERSEETGTSTKTKDKNDRKKI